MFVPTRHPHLLRREDTLLVVIDMQEPFLRVMHDSERLTANVLLLTRVAGLLAIPVVTTVQNRARLGGVAAPIAGALPEGSADPIDKLCFSCAGSPDFSSVLKKHGRSQVVLCGVETHICVAQTALDLAQAGYQVHVTADAVSSRTMERHKLGMERIRDSSVLPCAAEAAIYELLGTAGTSEFRAVLSLVK